MADINAFLETLPRDMLFVLRNNNLGPFVIHYLGDLVIIDSLELNRMTFFE
jgi:hypothetical protein